MPITERGHVLYTEQNPCNGKGRDMNDQKKMDIWNLWLGEIGGLGAVTVMKIRSVLGWDDPLFARRIFFMSEEEVTRLVSMTVRGDKSSKRLIQNILQMQKVSPECVQEKLLRSGCRAVSVFSPDYPQKLRQMDAPPFMLYYRGRLPDESLYTVSIVGSRRASSYGITQAQIFAAYLAEKKVQIVSGMALGIDGVSQWAALEAGGTSFAILGGGPDVVYPEQNRDLYERLCAEGGVISEYPPGTQARKQYFPMRNRIISGLCDVLLVVEARSSSGTLITVDFALSQGRTIFSVPGRNTDKTSEGCNRLISQGAFIAMDPSQLYEVMTHTERYTPVSAPLPEQIPVQASLPILDESEDAAEEDDTVKENSREADEPIRSKGVFAGESASDRIMACLDSSTPRNCNDILQIMSSRGIKPVPVQELLGILTKLSLEGKIMETEREYFILSP